MPEALSTLQLALLARQAESQRRLLQAEPIAIVGIGCRFPGGEQHPDAHSPEAWWELLAQGVDAIREVPADRWPLEPDGQPSSNRYGSFLRQVDQFEPGRFGLSPKEARAIDPQQRLLLEVALEALESAGLAPSQLRHQSCGVMVGMCTTDYAWRQLQLPEAQRPPWDLYFAAGNTFSMAAGRLAYLLGLQGPALAVDTACSSSLVAVDLACRSLRDRSCDLALAGGVSLLLSPINTLCFSRSGMLAGDGRCKTFDAAADGYVRGEGCGVVVLRRLADALAAGEPIRAVLRGTGVNQDGASAGLTVPSGDAQAALIQRTLEQAQLSGDGIDLLEAHGTGTALGDPIELKAMAPLYARPQRARPLLLSSVKTNLGHLEGAAGMAGLIKAVLQLERGLVAPHLHLRQPTPFVPWDQWAVEIPRQLRPWPEGEGPRRAAVSSFGFSGTNAHGLLEQAPEEARLPWPAPAPQAPGGTPQKDALLLSASTEQALAGLVARMGAWLPQQDPNAWGAICATSRAARSQGRWRLAIRAAGPADACRQLEALEQGSLAAASGPSSQAPRLAWTLASGQPRQEAKAALAAWEALGVQPSALVHPDPAPTWLAELVGQPPRLRLMPAAQAATQLAEHGYGLQLPLQAPTLEEAVRLWLAGCLLRWEPLAPAEPWPRQVLPSTPFDRQLCWLEALTASTNALQPGAAEPAAAIPLLHQRRWSPLNNDPSPGVQPPALVWPLQSDLEGLPAPDAADPPQPLVVTIPLEAVNAFRLEEASWQHWLPPLQALLQRSRQWGPVHWALPAQPLEHDPQPGALTPAVQALAALLRTWLREAGPQAGGLLWSGPHHGQLEALLTAGLPPPGQEWSLVEGALARVELTAMGLPAGDGLDPSAGDAEATWLISGGLGALGLASARWLVERGWRRLLLVGRRPPSPAQQQVLQELEGLGAELKLLMLDLAGPEQAVDQALEEAVPGPLVGILHAAGVLDDGLLLNQSPERCAAVAAAKWRGAQALDRLSRRPALTSGLRAFVAFSSVAAQLGAPGQGAYGAANGALDGLMAQRRAAGLPGLSVAWGPWAGAGMASRAPQRLQPIAPEQALAALGQALAPGASHQLPVPLIVADLRAAEGNHLARRCQALGEELQALAGDAMACQQATERALAELLMALGEFPADALQSHTRLDALGLDSLMAVELAAAVQEGLGVSLGLGALEGEPTLASLASQLRRLVQHPDALPGGQLNLAAEAALPPDLSATPLPPRAAEASTAPRTVLLTGATGFLGAYLLADQLERHPQLTVCCLVRAEGSGAAKARVQANLEHYGLWREAYGARVVGLPGDLAQPRLGLDQATTQQLRHQLDGILHNGAQLSYVAPYGQLRAANVGGTLEVLRLAWGAERLVPLELISSTAVYEAAAYRGQPIREDQDLPEWEGIHLGYSQTKWVAERLVLQAAARGLPVRLYRPPLIGGHSRTGAWHQDDVLHRLIHGCLALGEAPELAMELDLVPVDYVSAAVGALAWGAERPAMALHLHHPQPVLWQDLLQGLIAQGAPLRAVPLERWLERLAQEPRNPVYPLQPFFRQRWGPEQLTYPELNAPERKARPECQRTVAQLAKHGVHCPAFATLMGPYARSFLGAGA